MKKILMFFVAFLCFLVLVAATIVSMVRPEVIDCFNDNKSFNKIVVYGDTRTGHKAHIAIADRIKAEKPDMIIHTGDMGFNSSSPLCWIAYIAIEHKLWNKSTEYVPVRGNHEVNIAAYKYIFNLPNNNTYYSFKRGGVKFIILDVVTTVPIDIQQKEWLKNELESDKDMLKMVSMHAPMFSAGKYGIYSDIEPELHPLFVKNNVKFVFAGHVHSYERSYVDGINYVATGGGGGPLYDNLYENPYQVAFTKAYHYTVLTKINDGYSMIVYDIDGVVIDNFVVNDKLN